MGWDRLSQREKNLSPEFCTYPTRARKFQKKLQKNSKNEKSSFRHYFYPRGVEGGREREKKVIVPNSVYTRPGQENSEQNCKKIKKSPSSIIFSKNGDEIGRERGKKILVSNSVRTRPEQENFEKIRIKNWKIKKSLSGIIFSKNGRR